MTEASTEVSVRGAGMEHMSTPGIITQKMKLVVSDLEGNDLVYKCSVLFERSFCIVVC